MRPPRLPLDGLQQCLCPRLAPQFLLIPSLRTAVALRHVSTARTPATDRTRRSLRPQPVLSPGAAPHHPPAPSIDPKAKINRALRAVVAHLRAVPRNPPATTLALLSGMEKNGDISLSLTVYEAIMPYASVETVFALLADMKKRHVTPSSRIYHVLLKRLASAWRAEEMRKTVLAEMKDRWIQLLPEGEEAVLIGRIRDGKTKLVEEMLAEWKKKGRKPSGLVWRVLVRQLLNHGKLADAAKMFRDAAMQADEFDAGRKVWDVWRERREGELWQGVVYELLSLAAYERNIEETRYAFEYALADTPAFTLDAGLLLNILYTAARHGDTKLAHDVLRLNDASSIPCRQHHWAALLEANLRAEKLPEMFHILTQMRESGIPATTGTIASLASILPSLPSLEPDSLLHYFTAIPQSERDPAGLHLILRAFVGKSDIAGALEVYKSIPELLPHAPSLPDTTTYNILLNGCVITKDRNTAIFLLSEMVMRVPEKVVMDADTYDALISVALSAVDESNPDSWFDAFTYLQEMRRMRMSPGRATWVKLALGAGARGQGEMARQLVKEMKAVGWEVGKLETYINKWDRAKAGSGRASSGGIGVEPVRGAAGG